MATERDREKEAELESTMYTNCLLLGLDPSVLGVSGTAITARVGHFRHTNPKMGEQLLYFLLSALRGPVQAAKDFDKVWPIFDSAQSREFRKIVHGIISDLESQGALPRSNSRVSSLATCCGPRFVELLWQLSVHALREVHQRSFSADVASNPLPPELTEMSYLHAASLLPVSKARIALERRKFLKNANTAVHRQSLHSNLAHEMTAEFRILCAEEAYLQQELEKLQDDRNKAKLESELWDDHVNGSSGQTSHMVTKATRLWESLLARKGQHEVLASGPIEDLISHREHRYRISGPSLLAAMESSSRVSHTEDSPGDLNPSDDVRGQLDFTCVQGNNDPLLRTDDRSEKIPPTVDVAEVLRCWTHSLQRIHKQSLQLAKANDGEGPELLRSASDSDGSGHAESLKSTLAEHRQHLVSIEGLINQLKEAVPAMQKSITDLTDEVNTITSSIPTNDYNNRSISPGQAQSSGRTFEHGANEITDLASKLSSVQLEKASTNPAMKLPHLFSIAPNMSGRSTHTQRRTPVDSNINHPAKLYEKKLINQALSSDHVVDNAVHEVGDDHYIKSIRRSVREAALATPSSKNEVLTKVSPEKKSYEGTQHFFMPPSSSMLSQKKDIDNVPNGRKERSIYSTPDVYQGDINPDIAFPKNIVLDEMPSLLHDFQEFGHCSEMNGRLLSNKKNEDPGHKTNFTFDEAIKQSLSPTLLTESYCFTDTYEDLLAPLSETDAALMEQ